jgi:hypothetical protein
LKSGLTQPAFVGGLLMGVLSALPIISAGNLCCCAWVVSGGLLAAYILQQNQAEPITPGDGALVGLLAGLVGALVQSVLSMPISLLIGPMERQLTQRVLDMAGSMPPELREALERYTRESASGPFLILTRIVEFFFWLVIGSIFSTLGGLLGAAIFRKPPAPPGATGQ